MAVYSLHRFRYTGDVADCELSVTEAEELAEILEWEQHRERIRYDQQARELRQFGVEPAEVLGPRP